VYACSVKTLIEYVKATISHWVPILTGIGPAAYQWITSAIPGDANRDWWKKSMSLEVNILFFVAFLFYAQYKAWLDLHRKIKETDSTGPLIVGSVVIEHSDSTFGRAYGRQCHIKRYFFRINQPAIRLLLACRSPLHVVLSDFEEYSPKFKPMEFFANVSRHGNIAEIEFPSEEVAFGSLVKVELCSVEPVELLRIEAVRQVADPAPSTASEQAPPSSQESSGSKNASK
jgi:hypothetical protein